MDSSSSRRSDDNNTNKEKRHRQKFVSGILSPAIRGQNCPICLNNLSDRRAAVLTDCTHAYCLDCIRKWSNLKRNCPLCNAPFDSWFYKINLSTRNFLQQRLPPLGKGKTVTSQSHSSSRGPPQRKQDNCHGDDRLDGLDRCLTTSSLKENFSGVPACITNACKLFLYLLGIAFTRMLQ